MKRPKLEWFHEFVNLWSSFQSYFKMPIILNAEILGEKDEYVFFSLQSPKDWCNNITKSKKLFEIINQLDDLENDCYENTEGRLFT